MPVWTADSQTYRVLIFGCVCEPEVNQDPQHTSLQQHGSLKESNNLYHILPSFVDSVIPFFRGNFFFKLRLKNIVGL